MFQLKKRLFKIFLHLVYKFPHLKKLYKGSILELKDVINLYNNILFDKSSCNLLGSMFYGLEKVNYYTLDEVFTDDFYSFTTDTENPIIIDCGANIGLSMLYFKKTHENAIIHAFEPDSKNFNYLKKNVDSYGWNDSVFCYKSLVSNDQGYEFFEELGNAGSKIVNENQQNENTSKIEKIKLKDFILNLNKNIDFLKLDIEGSEFDVIPDLLEVFPKIDKMYIEFHTNENDFKRMYDFINLNLGEHFNFQISTNFTEDQNIYSSLRTKTSKTYYNCFAVNKFF
jgi:FkbM family methyltransferase